MPEPTRARLKLGEAEPADLRDGGRGRPARRAQLDALRARVRERFARTGGEQLPLPVTILAELQFVKPGGETSE